MRGMNSNKGRATTMPVGFAWGGAVSLVITFLSAAVLAWMISSEKIRQSQIGYGVMVILVISAFSGAKTASVKIQRRHLMVSIGAGVIYQLLLLAMTALFFGGQYSGVGESTILIMCGCLLAFLLRRGYQKPANARKMKLHYR